MSNARMSKGIRFAVTGPTPPTPLSGYAGECKRKVNKKRAREIDIVTAQVLTEAQNMAKTACLPQINVKYLLSAMLGFPDVLKKLKEASGLDTKTMMKKLAVRKARKPQKWNREQPMDKDVTEVLINAGYIIDCNKNPFKDPLISPDELLESMMKFPNHSIRKVLASISIAV